MKYCNYEIFLPSTGCTRKPSYCAHTDHTVLQDVYSIVYTDRARSQFVEVYKCTEDSAMEQPWQGRVVSLYQLVTLLVIPAILAMGCYQAVIRVLWKSSR